MEWTASLEPPSPGIDELKIVVPEKFIDGDPGLDQVKISLGYESSDRFSSDQIIPFHGAGVFRALERSRPAAIEMPGLHVHKIQTADFPSRENRLINLLSNLVNHGSDSTLLIVPRFSQRT